MKLSFSFFLILMILMSACSAKPDLGTPVTSPTQQTPSATFTTTYTSTATKIPTATPSPTNTPSKTPIPEELREELVRPYMTMVLVEINLNMLHTIAKQVNTGELVGFESFGAILGLAMVVNAVEEVKDEITIPGYITPYWQQALEIHEITKVLLGDWFNNEINSGYVLDEVDPYLEDISEIMKALEIDLADTFGFDPDEMQAYREEVKREFNEIFED